MTNESYIKKRDKCIDIDMFDTDFHDIHLLKNNLAQTYHVVLHMKATKEKMSVPIPYHKREIDI